jgi:hypothetical protein
MEISSSPAAASRSAIGALEALMRSRHSCRAFRSEAVEEAVIGRILAIAQLTPSWCNAQPWKVIVTHGAATEAFREGLVAHVRAHRPQPDIAFPGEYNGAYRDRRRVCGLQLYDAVGVARGDRDASGRQAAENFQLFGAPHVAIITTEAALASHAAFLRAHFATPKECQILCGSHSATRTRRIRRTASAPAGRRSRRSSNGGTSRSACRHPRPGVRRDRAGAILRHAPRRYGRRCRPHLPAGVAARASH